MSEILSQAEIEALLNSLSGDSELPSEAPGAPAPAAKQPAGGSYGGYLPATRPGSRTAVAYEVYDFRRPDKFSKEQLRTLQMLHETFARLAGSGLSAYLRCPVNIELISLEQVPYEEYLRSINSSVFTITSMPPLTGQAVLEIEFALVFTMLDKLLGGPGRTVNRNVLTDIERPLFRQTIERMFAALKSAWEGIVMINPGIEGLESSAQFVQIAPPSDIVVTILFEVKVANARGAMSICIPYLVLKPITTKLSAQKWFVSGSKKQSSVGKQILSQQIQRAKVDCSVKLGSTRISVQEFLGLREGDILKLNQRTESDLTMLVSKTPKFLGWPTLHQKRYHFHVSELIDP